MAQVTLVRIPNLFAAGALTLSAIPPLGLAYLAGSLRAAGHKVKIVDSVGEAIENIYYYGIRNLYINGLTVEELLQAIPEDSQYIGVACPFSHEWPVIRKVCLAIKQRFPDVTIICGGEHATAMPAFCLDTCSAIDYIVTGEGEETIAELIDALENGGPVADVNGLAFRDPEGKITSTKPRTRIRAIDEIPWPAWDLLPLENYLSGGYSFGVNIGRTIPIMATRGCPYQCTFCSNPQMWTTRWIARSPENVVAEMEAYIKRYNVSNFDFYDLTAIVKKDWLVKFCNLLIEKNLNISWQLPSGTRSEALDNESTDLLYQSGCRNLTYAPESGSPEILTKIKKKITPEKILDSMRASISSNINIKANLIIGFPGERLKNVLETYWFLMQMATIGVHDASMWVFSAYPGSALFDDLRKQNRIKEFSDDYFFSLLSYSDLRNVKSWNEHLSAMQLKYLRLFGIILFYLTSYITHPLRFAKNIRNIAAHKPQSRMEMIIEKAILRHKKGNHRVKLWKEPALVNDAGSPGNPVRVREVLVRG